MRFVIAAALALVQATSLSGQASPTPATTANQDLSYATPIAGSWAYSATADGSEATFSNPQGLVQLVVHCARATRRVTIAKLAGAESPFLSVWSSSLTKSVPSSFNPATGRVTIDFAPYDPLLDAIASSRGRIGVTIAGQAPLVVPAWAETARVIEDCRA